MKALKNDPVPVPDDMFKSRYPPITGSLWPALQMGNSHKLEVALVVVVVVLVVVVVHLLTKILQVRCVDLHSGLRSEEWPNWVKVNIVCRSDNSCRLRLC
jgi:hypothetical protein